MVDIDSSTTTLRSSSTTTPVAPTLRRSGADEQMVDIGMLGVRPLVVPPPPPPPQQGPGGPGVIGPPPPPLQQGVGGPGVINVPPPPPPPQGVVLGPGVIVVPTMPSIVWADTMRTLRFPCGCIALLAKLWVPLWEARTYGDTYSVPWMAMSRVVHHLGADGQIDEVIPMWRLIRMDHYESLTCTSITFHIGDGSYGSLMGCV